MKRPALAVAVLVVGGLGLASASLVPAIYHRLWPTPDPGPDGVLISIRLLFVAGVLDLVALIGCLVFVLATRHRFGGEGRWLGFWALAWLGFLPARATLELFRTGWLWESTRLAAVWPTADEYESDPGIYIALAMSIGVAFLFLKVSRGLFPGKTGIDGAAQQRDAPDEARG